MLMVIIHGYHAYYVCLTYVRQSMLFQGLFLVLCIHCLGTTRMVLIIRNYTYIMIILTRPISAQYFNALYQVELFSILYITHTNNFIVYSFVNKLISIFYYKEY